MDLVKFQREMEEYQRHINRVRTVQPCTDTTTPKSLGLKHLKSRPKKQQLIDDRNQVIAAENKKMMENMTKIMCSEKAKEKRFIAPSLNETERKMEVDRINMENNLLISRLKSAGSTFDTSKMLSDFKRHQEVSQQMRRRQMPDMSKLLHSPQKQTPASLTNSFDAQSYIGQHASSTMLAGESSIGSIKTVSDFRRQVMSTKRGQNN